MLFGSAEKAAKEAEEANRRMGDEGQEKVSDDNKLSQSDEMDSEEDAIAHRRNRRKKRALFSGE